MRPTTEEAVHKLAMILAVSSDNGGLFVDGSLLAFRPCAS